MRRLKTEIPGLDQILSGGIPELATVLIAGAPGTGKTILAQNILFNIARHNEKVMYVSTIAEPRLRFYVISRNSAFFRNLLLWTPSYTATWAVSSNPRG